jgi:hypothetical protein
MDNLPAPAVITSPRKIPYMVCISKWATWGRGNFRCQGMRAKERLGHHRRIFRSKRSRYSLNRLKLQLVDNFLTRAVSETKGVSEACSAPPFDSPLGYLARFQTTCATPPTDAVGLLTHSSSPLTVQTCFLSSPSQLGKVLPSLLRLTVCSFSLTTVYLP